MTMIDWCMNPIRASRLNQIPELYDRSMNDLAQQCQAKEYGSHLAASNGSPNARAAIGLEVFSSSPGAAIGCEARSMGAPNEWFYRPRMRLHRRRCHHAYFPMY